MLSEAKITERALLDCWTVSFVLNTDVGGLNSLSLCPSWKQEVPLLLKAVSSPFLFTRHPKLSKAFTEPRFQTHTWCWHFYRFASLFFLLLTDHSRFLCGPSIVRVQPYEYLGVYTDSSLEFSSLLGLLSCTAETTCSYADCTCAHINCYFWQKILYSIFGKFLR